MALFTYNEAFGLHGPELWATNEKTHASFRIAPHTCGCRNSSAVCTFDLFIASQYNKNRVSFCSPITPYTHVFEIGSNVDINCEQRHLKTA